MARNLIPGRRLLRLCAASILGLSLPAAHAAEPASGEPVDATLARMEETLSEVRTVRTRFVQEKHLALFKNPLVTRGTILVEPPAKLLWRVESPIQYVLAIDGDRARQWDGETGKTQTFSMDSNPVFSAVAEQLNAWFGGRYAVLAREYDIVLRSEQPVVFDFVPKPETAPAKMLKSVLVTFREDGRYIASIQIDELGGDRSVLRFEETEINAPIGPKEWNP